MILEGRVWKFGNDIDTDAIIPARFLNVSDAKELALNCFADLRPSFASGVRCGDIIVAGSNFGCGSSREHAPLAIKAAGIAAVVAVSFARIFYRNALNIGLPIMECREVEDAVKDGDTLSIDLERGEVMVLPRKKRLHAAAMPTFMMRILKAGGLVEAVAKGVVF
jgi:3-isopropylmalate dehydratase small subunit